MVQNALLLVPCIALLACASVLTAALVRRSNEPARRAFVSVVGALFAWNLMELLGFFAFSEGFEFYLLRATSALSIMIGVLAYRFATALARRRPGRLAPAILVLSVAASLISVTTPWAVAGYMRRPWGLLYLPGPLDAWFTVIPWMGTALAINQFRLGGINARTRHERGMFRAMTLGAAFALLAGTLTDIVFIHVLERPELPRFTAASLSVFAFFAAWAMVRHDFLGLEKIDLLENAFEHSNDSLLLIHEQGEVVDTNRSAHGLFGPEQDPVGRDISTVLETLVATNPDRHYTVSVNGHTNPLESSVHQVPRFAGSVHIRDVTKERNQMEAARALFERVSSQERWLRLVIDSLPIGLMSYQIDEEGLLRLRHVNEAATTILGIASEDVVGKTIQDAFPGLRETSIPERYAGVARTGVALDVEEVPYSHDSITGIYEVHAFATGENAMVVSFRDITDRREQEKTLIESEERFRATFEQAAVGIVQASLDGSFLRMNQRFCDIVGYSRDELSQMDILDLAHFPDIRFGLDQWHKLTRGQIETFVSEARFRQKSGAYVWVNMTSSLQRYDDTDRSYFIIVVEDVTARKVAELTLTKLSSAVENSPNPILITESDGSIAYVNSIFNESTGFAWSETVGRPLDDFYVGSASSTTGVALRDAMVQGIAWRGEIDCVKKNGESYPAIVSAAPVWSDEGRLSNYVIIEQDMTAHRQMEAQLTQTIKLQAIGQLTGGVAHDFNNLLTIIINNVGLLVEELIDAEQKAIASDALAAAERGGELTSQLLSFSRRQALRPRELDLNRVIEHALKLMRRTLGSAIEILPDLDPAVWPVLCDPGQMENVLLNLAINARDAMPSGGRIVFTSKNTSITTRLLCSPDPIEPGDYVLLSVRDTGRGMSPSIIEHAFEPFFTTKEAGRGTGLGLSMVYGFVRQSGGYARIESAEGTGTCVHLYVPRFQRPPQRTGDEASPCRETIPGGTERILVAEDDPTVRKSTVRALTGLGYGVIEVETGREALTILEGGAPVDLLLSDVTMPGGLTGFELMAEVAPRWPQLRLLLTTGFVDTTHIKPLPRAFSEIEILNKPFGPRQLASAVRRALDAPKTQGTAANP
ncbi:MAG: PAS domain S-box protein [Deltaproteobacteria bacterium]|nr:PAS domain S-box protein [Deltaproteobacteria bacterium]